MSLQTDLRTKIAELRREQEAAKAVISSALLAGADTAPLRAELAGLNHCIALIEAKLAEAAAQREAAAQQTISASAAVVAADAENSIASTVAALQAPPHP